MRRNNQVGLTEKNLDQLAEFLSPELEQPALAAQIPDGAHIFHGSYDDTTLTQANLQLASKTLLGMTLGYIEDAPLVMVFEYQPGRRTVVDLSSFPRSSPLTLAYSTNLVDERWLICRARHRGAQRERLSKGFKSGASER